MAKKKTNEQGFEAPDYEKITTEEEADGFLADYKTDIHRKVKQLFQAKENKKEEMAAFNEVIKQCTEELDHMVGVVDALNTRKRQIQAAETQIPAPQLKSVS